MLDDKLKARIQDALDPHGDLSPPWARHPDYTRYSLGWRMGSGEDWLILFWAWLGDAILPGEARRAFLKRHPLAPRTWAGIVQQILVPGASSEIDPEAIEALVEAGFVGDDVAYGAWCLTQGRVPGVPWAISATPAEAARYDTRGFAFWARWCCENRAAHQDFFWSKQPPEAWRSLADAAVRGDRSSQGPDLSEGWSRLAWELVLSPSAPPPWAMGMAADAWEDAWELEAGYADAWVAWAWSVFDDKATWHTYTEVCPEPPSDWKALIDAELVF